MFTLLTSIARVKDWKALQQVNEILADIAMEMGARNYRIYRNVYDASQVLYLIELPNGESAEQMSQNLTEAIQAWIARGGVDSRVWEPTEWQRVR